jgi:hypothetical protein
MSELTWLGDAISVGGALMNAQGTLAAGNTTREAAYADAAGMERQAGQVRAQSQRTAAEDKRQGRLVQSRVQALAAASGAGAQDPTVLDIQGNIEQDSEYRALSDMYAGDTQAQSLEDNARVTRKYGRNIQKASRTAATGTLLETGATLWDKYGPKKKAPADDEMDPELSLPWGSTTTTDDSYSVRRKNPVKYG